MHISGVDQNLMQAIFVHISVSRLRDMSPLVLSVEMDIENHVGILCRFLW